MSAMSTALHSLSVSATNQPAMPGKVSLRVEEAKLLHALAHPRRAPLLPRSALPLPLANRRSHQKLARMPRPRNRNRPCSG